MNQIIVLGQLDTSDGTREQANRIYSAEGLAPCINTCGGGADIRKSAWLCEDARGVSSTLRSHEARPDAEEFKTTGESARQYAQQEN